MKELQTYIIEKLKIRSGNKNSLDETIKDFYQLKDVITEFINDNYPDENIVISKISTITANWPISSKVKYNVKTYQSFNIDFKQNNIVSKGIRVGQISTDKIVFQYKERTNGTRAEYYPICGLDNGMCHEQFTFGKNLLEWLNELKNFRNNDIGITNIYKNMPLSNYNILKVFKIIE